MNNPSHITVLAILLGLLLYLIIRPYTLSVSPSFGENVQGLIYTRGAPIEVLSGNDPLLYMSQEETEEWLRDANQPSFDSFYDVLVSPFHHTLETYDEDDFELTEDDAVEGFETMTNDSPASSRQMIGEAVELLKDTYGGAPIVSKDADVSITYDKGHTTRKYNYSFNESTGRMIREKDTTKQLKPIGQKISDLENKIRLCQIRTMPAGMEANECGYCMDDQKYHHYLESSPNEPADPTKRCTSTRFMTKESAVVELLERQECKKVKNCSQTFMDEESPCRFVKSLGYAIPVNGLNKPKYGDNIKSDDIITTEKQCEDYNAYLNHPCTGPNSATGPHSKACLAALWNEAGCSTQGSSAPQRHAASWWNQRSVDAVRRDMRLYKQFETTGSPYTQAAYRMRCSGIKTKPCDIMYNDGTPTLSCYREIYMKEGCQYKGNAYPGRATMSWSKLRKEYPNVSKWTKFVQEMKGLTVDNKNKHAHNMALQQCINPDLGTSSIYSCNPHGIEVYAFHLLRKGHAYLPGTMIAKFDVKNFNFNLGTGIVHNLKSENIMLHHYTYLDIEHSGRYDFRVRNDDGVRVFINDRAVLSSWQPQGPDPWREFYVHLNKHEKNVMRVEWYERGGGATLQVQWIPPNIKRKVITKRYRSWWGWYSYTRRILAGPWSNIPDSVFRRQDYADDKPSIQFDLGSAFSPYNVPSGYIKGTGQNIKQKTVDNIPCAYFNGVNSGIKLTPHGFSNIKTITFFMKLQDLKNNLSARIMEYLTSTNFGQDSMMIHTGMANGDLVYIQRNAKDSITVSSPEFFEENKWVHGAIVFRGDDTEIYKNGESTKPSKNIKRDPEMVKRGQIIDPGYSFSHIHIGRSNDVRDKKYWEHFAKRFNFEGSRVTYSNNIKGCISYIHMYDRELTPEQVKFDYKRVRMFDSSKCSSTAKFCGLEESDKAICKMFYKSGLALNSKDTESSNDIYTRTDLRYHPDKAKSKTGMHYAYLEYKKCNPLASK